jgi:hypothetical protein
MQATMTFIQNHENSHNQNTAQSEPKHGKYEALNLVVVRHKTDQATRLPLQPERLLIGHNMLYQAHTARIPAYILYIRNYRYIM